MQLNDIQVETNVIACLLRDSDAWLRMPDNVGESDFTSPLLRGIFTILDHHFAEGIQTDWVIIADALPESLRAELRKVGDWSFLETLKSLPINPNNVEHEAKKLKDLTIRRRMSEAGSQISQFAEKEKDIDDILNDIEIVVGNIPGDLAAEVYPIGKFGAEYVRQKMESPSEVPGLPSGFSAFDKITGGFRPGMLYITSARMKVGKSLALLNWAKNVSIDNQEPVLWVSTEHGFELEFPRLLSIVSKVPIWRIDRGLFVDNLVQMARIEDALEKIENSPFHFTYMPEFSLSKIKRIVRKYSKVHNVKGTFFDYIKPPASESKLTEWQELGNFTFGLKALAEKYRIPLVTAVQINRIGENLWREDGELSFAQVAGSDRIGHAMDYGMILRPLNKRERDKAGFAGEEARILEIAESRHGGNYRRIINFAGDTLTFTEGSAWEG